MRNPNYTYADTRQPSPGDEGQQESPHVSIWVGCALPMARLNISKSSRFERRASVVAAFDGPHDGCEFKRGAKGAGY